MIEMLVKNIAERERDVYDHTLAQKNTIILNIKHNRNLFSIVVSLNWSQFMINKFWYLCTQCLMIFNYIYCVRIHKQFSKYCERCWNVLLNQLMYISVMLSWFLLNLNILSCVFRGIGENQMSFVSSKSWKHVIY